MIVRRTTFAVYLLVFVILCDQLSKYWVLTILTQLQHGIRVTPFLNFVLIWNKGVTFGLLNQFNPRILPLLLTCAALLIFVLLGRWLTRTTSTWVAVSLGAIMGGAIGNVVDRLRFGAVIDFLDFYYGNYHWYAFNIADACIVTGVCFLVLDSLVRGR